MGFVVFQVDNMLLVIVAGLAIACFPVFYVLMQRSMRRHADQLRREFEERFEFLAKSRTVESTAAPNVRVAARAADVLPAKVSTPPSVPEPAPIAKPQVEEVDAETLLVIAAAVTAFLGKAVRIRSARMLYSHESFNAWSQQGRAVIQASHNLAQRGF
jgi:hypothetical protein